MIFNNSIPRKIFIRFLLLLGRKELARIPPYLIITNWIFQRILGINREIPISTHYTSRVQGFNNMKLGSTAKYSIAVSACANIVVVDGTTLTIGEKSIFAQNVCIRTANHDLINRSKYIKKSVFIGENVWLGHGVVVLPGVTIGNNVTIGANSVVTKDIPANTVAAGIPAKPIKKINLV